MKTHKWSDIRRPPKDKFRKRVEKILKHYEVFGYAEERRDAQGKEHGVEFTIRRRKKSYELESCVIGLHDLNKLAKLFGTQDVSVTGYDGSLEEDGSDSNLYVLAWLPA